MKGMYQDVEITTTLTFSCARCWGKLRAKEDKKGEIVVEFCQDCRTDAEAEGYERGLAEGKAAQE
jgi:uncharacterized metal-binding protein YceD (DUF177 family)